MNKFTNNEPVKKNISSSFLEGLYSAEAHIGKIFEGERIIVNNNMKIRVTISGII